MTRNIKRLCLAVALVGLPLSAFAANAQERNNDARERASLAQAKTSLSDAVAAAERQAGGKAVSADLESGKQGLRWQIEVAQNDATRIVHVDAKTGAVAIEGPEGDGDGEEDDD